MASPQARGDSAPQVLSRRVLWGLCVCACVYMCMYMCMCTLVCVCMCVQEGTGVERDEPGELLGRGAAEGERQARLGLEEDWGGALQLSTGPVVQARESQECPASLFRLLNMPNPSVLEKCHLKVLLKTNPNTTLIFAYLQSDYWSQLSHTLNSTAETLYSQI